MDSDELDAVEVSNELLGYNGYVFDGHITNDDTTQINDDEENNKIPYTPDNNLEEQGSDIMEYKKEPTCSDDVVITTEDKEMISDIQSDVAGKFTLYGVTQSDTKGLITLDSLLDFFVTKRHEIGPLFSLL